MSFAKYIIGIARKVARAVIDEELHTNMGAQVVSYDNLTNTASIQPFVTRFRTQDSDNLTTIQLPQCDDVPVGQQGSGKCLLSVAPQAGSYGKFYVSESDISAWMLKGGITDPAHSRKFDISDGWFEPGLYPLIPDGDNGLIVVPINTDRIEMRTRLGTAFVAVVDDGTIEIESPLGSISVNATTGQVDINGNLTVDI